MKYADAQLRNGQLRYIAKILLPCIYFFVIPASIAGLDRDRAIYQFHHTSWTSREGAPGKIRAIAQTTDGSLWLSSPNGLYRFDGIAFEKIEPSSLGLISENLYTLKAAPDGGLWIGYWNGGAAFLKDGRLQNFGVEDGLPSRGVRGFTIDRTGAVWAATGAGLFVFAGERWEQRFANVLPDTNIQAAFQDSRGTFWAVSGNSVLFRKDGEDSFTRTDEVVTHVPLITEGPGGTIWIAETPKSVRPVSNDRNQASALGPEVIIGSPSVVFDRDGGLWIASLGEGVRRVVSPDNHRGKVIQKSGTEAEDFREKDGLSSDSVNAIFEDHEGNIWTATANGLDRFRRSHVVPVRLPDSFQNFALSPSSDGQVWVGGLNGGLMRANASRAKFHSAAPAGINSLFAFENGSVLIGAKDLIPRRKITRWSDNILAEIGVPPGADFTEARTVLAEQNGTIWA